MPNIRAIFTSTLAVVLLAACGNLADAPRLECTMQANSSIGLSLVDAASYAPLDGAEVRFTVDGGTERVLTCDGGCAFGWEEAGVFNVVVRKAGYRELQFEVRVGRDACHVIPVGLKLLLVRA